MHGTSKNNQEKLNVIKIQASIISFSNLEHIQNTAVPLNVVRERNSLFHLQQVLVRFVDAIVLDVEAQQLHAQLSVAWFRDKL